MAKVSINTQEYSFVGWTALQAEVQELHFNVVEKFLQAKANVNSKANHYSGLTSL